MPTESEDTTETLEHIAFLSRSENRVAVLEALTETMTSPGQDTPGYEPRDLQDLTGASEATLSRILTEFQERGWARRDTAGKYIATPLGQHVAVQFEPLVSSLESLAEVGAAMALIPPTEMSRGTADEVYSLSEFEDVTVHRPTAYEPTPAADYYAELIRNSTTWYVLTWFPINEPAYEALNEGIQSGRLTCESVLAGNVLEHYHDPDTYPPDNEQQRENLALPNLQRYRYDGHLPCNLFIYDETVLVVNPQIEMGQVEPGTTIESQNETVRQWALDVFERYRTAAAEITPEDIPS